ncbi:MAG: hypothetical protein Q9219_007202 [cf. Caloplaca sp. 3 TL-2023]
MSYYDELYVGPSVRRTEKHEWSVRGFGPTTYTFATIPHEHHRLRRAAVAPHFSKQSVQHLEPSVQSMVDKLMSRLESFKGTGSVVNLIHAFACMTSDIICQYSFAAPYGYLEQPEFAPYWHRAVMEASEGSHFFKQFPWIETGMRALPGAVATRMAPQLASLFLMGDMVRDKISEAEAKIAEGKEEEGKDSIIYKLALDENLPKEEKSPARMEMEFVALVAAGSATVAHTLSSTAYHIIANKEILTRLQEELGAVAAQTNGPLRWNRLEQLPYLTAVILEGLRWSNGVSHRLQRISPDLPLQYKEHTIPKGLRPFPSPTSLLTPPIPTPQTNPSPPGQKPQTPIGMTSLLTHYNPTLFPSPHTFDPTRWLQPDSARLKNGEWADSEVVSLAYCELYLTLAALFAPGRFKFELFGTEVGDVEVWHDFFNASQRVGSRGIRVVVG